MVQWHDLHFNTEQTPAKQTQTYPHSGWAGRKEEGGGGNQTSGCYQD